MIRTILSLAAATAIMSFADAGPSVGAERLTGSSTPTACDCTNCSAEHCQPTGNPKPPASNPRPTGGGSLGTQPYLKYEMME